MKRRRYYALYRGDELLAHGNIDEIAKTTGYKINYLKMINAPCMVGRQKMDLIKVED